MFSRHFDSLITSVTTRHVSHMLVDLASITTATRLSAMVDHIQQLYRAAARQNPQVHLFVIGPPHQNWKQLEVQNLVRDGKLSFTTHAWCRLLPAASKRTLPVSRKYVVASNAKLTDTKCAGCREHRSHAMPGLERAEMETKAITALLNTLDAAAAQAPAPHASDVAIAVPDLTSMYTSRTCLCMDRDCEQCSHYFLRLVTQTETTCGVPSQPGSAYFADLGTSGVPSEPGSAYFADPGTTAIPAKKRTT
eukprot:533548-Amphidinium_carterae.1